MGWPGGLLMAAGSAATALIPAQMRAPVRYLLVALVNCAAMGVLWLGPLRRHLLCGGVAVPVHGWERLCDVYGGDSGVSGGVGEEREREVFDDQFAGECAGAVYGAGGRLGRGPWGGRGLAGAECVVGAVGAVALLACFLTRGRRIGQAEADGRV